MACYIYKGNTYTKEELLAIKNQIIAENEAVFNQMGSEALNDINVLVDQLVKGGLAEEVIVGNTQTLLDVLDEEGASEGLKQQVQQGPERQIILNGQGVTVRTFPEDVSVINGFYSPIEKRLAETKIDKQSANKWVSVIGKGDEATWTGVKAWLEEKNPQEQVTKSEIQQWMKDNRISVVEVVKGKTEWSEVKKGRWERPIDKENLQGRKTAGKVVIQLIDGKYYGEPSTTKYTRVFNSLEEAQSYYDGVDGFSTDTKFSKWQLEGEKENYKEVLVTMPNVTKQRMPEGFSVVSKSEYKGASEWTPNFVVIDKDGVSIVGGKTKEAALDTFFKTYAPVSESRVNFKSGHWDEPNILVHLRMNTRTDAEGNKVLFLEEVQSDFSAAYRKSQEEVMNFISKNEGDVIELYKKSGKLEVEC